MPFKPLSHLARISFAKGVTHAYTPGAVVAGQQGLGSLHSYPVAKLSKTAHIQNAFSTASGSGNGAGAKAGHASTSGTSDGSLTQYFAAFNLAQQTGDDTELKKHQGARKVGWKQSDRQVTSKASARLDNLKPTDILRQPVRLPVARSLSDNVVQQSDKAEDRLVEVEALAKIDEAIALEIKAVNESKAAEAIVDSDNSLDIYDADSAAFSDSSNAVRSPTTGQTSPVSDESSLRSEEIVELGEHSRYADIPYQFQSMVKDGLVPNVHAYNYIIQSAINLASGYQPFPRAVEVFNDMTAKGIQPNEDTYRILIAFLSTQSLLASKAQKELQQHEMRYGSGQVSFTFPSIKHKQELFSEDVSILMATKFYNIARRELSGFRLSDTQYAIFLEAYRRSGASSSMAALSKDMHSQQLLSSPENCVAAIDACAQVKDLASAKEIYQQYRDLAINYQTNVLLDNKAYTALIRAYYASGEDTEGLRFFERVIKSFDGASNKDALTQDLTDVFVTDGLVEHYIKSGDMHQVLETLKVYSVSESARSRAVSKILSAAADNNQAEIVDGALAVVPSANLEADAIMAVAAMQFRVGKVVQAKSFWNQNRRVADVSFATMYGLSILSTGDVEGALSDILSMFREIRQSLSEKSRSEVNSILDESVLHFGQTLSGGSMLYSSQAAVLLFRVMIENGGLVPYITQAAIARVGPECVNQLSDRDIALALHVQAYMLPAQAHAVNDVAQAARFSHLLETILQRRIGMDPATVHAVDNALPSLGGARPDLERRWKAWRSPDSIITQTASPASSFAQARESQNHANLYDPYSHTTDHRASKVISELLESTTGRMEAHLTEAMSKFKNVRRMGRRLQYSTYAKLITTAGKVKQQDLMREILAMAQTDVPYNPTIAAVRSGWITIYDSMIAACLTVGQRQAASKFHEELLSMGAAPSANTFGIYITTLEGTFDEASEAVKIFQRAVSEGVTPTVFLFNAVIGKLGKARRIDDCLQYFGQMQNLGIRPSSVTYGTLVNALCRTSEESFAVEMFDEMEAAPNYRPRPAPYNSIIQYFLNTKRDRAKVLQYYGRMRSRDIKPTSHTFKLLIEAYATLEPVNLAAAETVLEDMKVSGVQPEAVHYGALIHAKGCVLSDMSGARATFDSVLADPAIKATDNLYQNLLEAMVANHQVADSEPILTDMARRGVCMTAYIANTLIHGWAAAGDVEKAKSIYDSLGFDKREPSTYEAMTRAFLSVENHTAANAVVQQMLTKGYPSAVADKVLGLIGST
ncbi:hypothetical protein LTR05_004822 [Lithohypha guttulata]|uniref:Tetratricopeptide repeat domain-containing protein n=1 Tax=Lithohypha guttulata TaxID=1690604 RepID=A0AAN7SZ72_9EURO|nr:hypothetical protein LTR05_004822 [Lithohypha guttulata]